MAPPQADWRFCRKCSSLFLDGFPQKGVCPAGGPHEAFGFMYFLPHDMLETPTAQHNWRFCPKCKSMYFDGFPQKGVCPAGGPHEAFGFMYVLPHDIPHAVDFDFNPIVLGDVSGNAHVTLRQDGSFTFSGDFHDPGEPDFDDAIVVAIKDSQNFVYTFQHTGHVAGAFSPGSSDDIWRIDSRSEVLAANWAYIATGSSGHQRSTTSLGIANIFKAFDGLIGSLGPVFRIFRIEAPPPPPPAPGGGPNLE